MPLERIDQSIAPTWRAEGGDKAGQQQGGRGCERVPGLVDGERAPRGQAVEGEGLLEVRDGGEAAPSQGRGLPPSPPHTPARIRRLISL